MYIAIDYRDELKKAFNAGAYSVLARQHGLKGPKTFEDYMEEQSKRPTVARL